MAERDVRFSKSSVVRCMPQWKTDGGRKRNCVVAFVRLLALLRLHDLPI